MIMYNKNGWRKLIILKQYNFKADLNIINYVFIFTNSNSNYARTMRPLYKVQNKVKINKTMKKYLLYCHDFEKASDLKVGMEN